jgi:hypothetical protein
MHARGRSVDHRRMLVDVLGAALFLAAFMVAWSAVGAWQERRTTTHR